MSEYVADLAEALCRISDFRAAMPFPWPESAIADNSYVCLSWGSVDLSRSHGEPTWMVGGPAGRTEHTSVVRAVRCVAGLLDIPPSAKHIAQP